MDVERKDTQHHLYNVALHSQLADKDFERSLIEDELKEEISKLRQDNEFLRTNLTLLSTYVEETNHKLGQLCQEISDQKEIIYSQANEINNMGQDM
jgi:pantothenate kinase type III